MALKAAEAAAAQTVAAADAVAARGNGADRCLSALSAVKASKVDFHTAVGPL